MSKLGRFWRWLEPGLIYVDPMIAIAYCQATGEMEMTSTEGERAVRPSIVEKSNDRAGRYRRPLSVQTADRS